ncbi:uncharacterized protein LOC127728918 [Mytilus californianus]|uniref:uncharacterized protein LOC127728918 n=1 Tax=Mytilus californianus TaxID=6549 RepID=UPI002247DEBC|nr:uncharacterized protein LOC127728918 [Mytilus californianus]
MARKKKGWTPKQGKWSKEGLIEAVCQVKSGSMSKLKASKIYNIPRTTLLRRLKTMDLDSPATIPTVLAIKVQEGKDQRKREKEEKKKTRELEQTLKKSSKAKKNTQKRLAKKKKRMTGHWLKISLTPAVLIVTGTTWMTTLTMKTGLNVRDVAIGIMSRVLESLGMNFHTSCVTNIDMFQSVTSYYSGLCCQ